jgi:RsiW-degrading membrane proteinase PrsW (M82 family)
VRSTNGLYFVVGALIVVVGGLGAYIYHEQTKPKGVEMSIGQNGVSIEQK